MIKFFSNSLNLHREETFAANRFPIDGTVCAVYGAWFLCQLPLLFGKPSRDE